MHVLPSYPKLSGWISLLHLGLFSLIPQAVVEHTHMSSEMFILYLHQNYIDFYEDLDDIVSRWGGGGGGGGGSRTFPNEEVIRLGSG